MRPHTEYYRYTAGRVCVRVCAVCTVYVGYVYANTRRGGAELDRIGGLLFVAPLVYLRRASRVRVAAARLGAPAPYLRHPTRKYRSRARTRRPSRIGAWQMDYAALYTE